MKWRTLIQHQRDCVQISKPLTIEKIQATAKSQEITQQIDEMQSVDENGNLLRNIMEESEQLRNEMKRITEQVVNVDKKTEEIDVYKEVCKENYETTG